MVLDWLLCAVGLFVTALLSGVLVAVVGSGRNWPAKRMDRIARFSFAGVIALDYFLRLTFPWAIRERAQRGFPFAVAVGVGLLSLFAKLAAVIAQRVLSAYQT